LFDDSAEDLESGSKMLVLTFGVGGVIVGLAFKEVLSYGVLSAAGVPISFSSTGSRRA